MHAVLRINLQLRPAALFHDFIHRRRAIAGFRRGIFGQVHIKHDLRIGQFQVIGLPLFVAEVGEKHAAQAVKREHIIGLGIGYRVAGGGFSQAVVVAAVVRNRPRRAAFEHILLQRGISHRRPHAPFESGAHIAHFVELLIKPAALKTLLVAVGFFATFQRLRIGDQHIKHRFCRQHAGFQGGVNAFDARHV